MNIFISWSNMVRVKFGSGIGKRAVLCRLAWVTLLVAFLSLSTKLKASTNGLVAAYGFNEGNGLGLIDLSGHGNNGLVHGATWTAGRFGNALLFDGVSAFVDINDSTSLHLSNAMTLEAWVYPTINPAGWMDVIYKENDIYYLEGSSIPNGVPAAGGNFSPIPVYAPTALGVNTWSHIASTYDGNVIRLFINGVQVASKAQGGLITSSRQPLSLGGDTVYGQHWSGKIDEVRIYNRALSVAELQADMSSAVGPSVMDSNPPSVSILGPIPDSTVSHVVMVNAEATDDTEVASVEFFIDGVSLQTVVVPPYRAIWNTTAATNGAHILTAVATDIAGNQITSAPVLVKTLNPAFVNEVVVPGIVSATTIAFLPDGRMLVGELTETVWIVQPGNNQQDTTPFLRLDNSQLFGEQGLMDIVLDPQFSDNHYIYIFYTRGFPGQHNRDRVSRFTVTGNIALPGSEMVVWQDDVDANEEHHGGALAFGPSDKLFITVGEHFNPPDAQRLDTYHGKLLRVNRDGTIPNDNPFYDGAGPNRDEIWAYGLRNPFRMSYDAVTGRMFIGDVGGNDFSTAFEEVNLVARGANYGWPLCEGYCGLQGVTDPLFAYFHFGRDACVAGGFVYRGSQFPSEYYGSYFFGDYVQNWIKRITFDNNGNFDSLLNFEPADGSTDGPIGDPVKLVEGPDGSVYYVDIGFNDAHVPNDASIRRIRYTVSNQTPVANGSAIPSGGSPPLQVSFSSAGSFDPEGSVLSYIWTFGDGATSVEPNPIHIYQNAGLYTARLVVSDGTNSALSTNIVITVGNPPVVTVLSPADGSTFRAGQVITFSGVAIDAEEGAMPPSSFSWSIVFHHASHNHPGGGPFTNIDSGTFTVPESGHDFSGATSYEFILSVTDSNGLRGANSVTIFPDKVNVSFNSIPSGLALDLAGIRKITPFVQDALIGFQYPINAPEQTLAGLQYQFASWSDGGSQAHSILVPATNSAVSAFFNVTGSSGLVAAYGFEESDGNVVKDLSGNGNDGFIEGALWTPGRYGTALLFNGIDAWVTISNSSSLGLSNGMTLEAWVKPATVDSGWRDVIYKGEDIYFLEGTTSNGGFPGAGADLLGNVYASEPLTPNVWAHLCATYDGAVLRMYVDGVQVDSRSQTGLIPMSSSPLHLGGDEFFGQFFDGILDEVRVYNRALAAAEIQADMILPISKTVPSPKLALATLGGSSLVLRLSGIAGLTYRISIADKLDSPVWQDLGRYTLNPFGFVDITNTIPASSSQRFFRSIYP
jgi:glucose/arabinose dehydrogenase/PKD repeat protein